MVDLDQNVRMVLEFYCHLLPLADRSLLVWHENKSSCRGGIQFRVLDLDKLGVLGATKQACEQMAKDQLRVLTAGGELASCSIPTDLEMGAHEVTTPKELQEIDEVLLLVHSTAGSLRSNCFDQMNLVIWVVQPRKGRLEVIPQDWFNQGNYDFGYQWVSRIARDPDSGRIVGEGVRLGLFELDGSNRRIHEWIVSEHFYHPER